MWLLSALGELTEGILHRHYWDDFIHTPVELNRVNKQVHKSYIIYENTRLLKPFFLPVPRENHVFVPLFKLDSD